MITQTAQTAMARITVFVNKDLLEMVQFAKVYDIILIFTDTIAKTISFSK